jgi:predicted small lipoprotein YifL
MFVWCRRLGDIAVNRASHPLSSRWAAALLAAAVLALAGCGRKGPLDLPPAATPPTSAAMQGDTEAEQASKPTVFNPSYSAEAAPAAAKGRKKSFVLDPLLGD